MAPKTEKARTASAFSDGEFFYARFKPALSAQRLDAVLGVAPPPADFIPSKKGRIKEIAFKTDQFEPGLAGPPDFLQHLGRMAARIKHNLASDTVEFRPKNPSNTLDSY